MKNIALIAAASMAMMQAVHNPPYIPSNNWVNNNQPIMKRGKFKRNQRKKNKK